MIVQGFGRMRSQFLLVPVAIVAGVATTPAQAEVYMTVDQAQKAMFPDASFTEHFIELDQDQYNAIIDDSNVVPYSRKVRAWRVSTGGWFIIDQVRGKDDWVSYAISFDANGAVKHIEVLECLEHYDGIRNPGWLSQFYGRKHGTPNGGVQIISGSTLSSGQMMEGVKRLISTVSLILSTDPGAS